MNKDGKVISLRLLVNLWPPKVDPVFTKAAVEALRSWRYRPPAMNSQPPRFEFGGPIVVKFSTILLAFTKRPGAHRAQTAAVYDALFWAKPQVQPQEERTS